MGILASREWHKQGLCANEASDWWFYDMPTGGNLPPEVRNQIQVAVNICQDCPVKLQCLEQGLEDENLINGSIWGGMLYHQRRGIAKMRKHKR